MTSSVTASIRTRRTTIVTAAVVAATGAGLVAPAVASADLLGGSLVAFHYQGVSTGNQSTVTLHKGEALREQVSHPESAVEADADPTTNTVSNIKATIRPMDIVPVAGLPLTAHVESTLLSATGTMKSTGVSDVYDVTSTATTRLAVTLSLGGVALTDPKTCFVDAPMHLTGTTNAVSGAASLVSDSFVIPNFPATGCGLFGALLTGAVSGSNNVANLNYVKGTF